MTSYSIMPAGPRTTVVATWTGGNRSDYSAKITTVEPAQASHLAQVLTRISEDAWDAAAFLDTHPVIEAAIAALIEQLRGTAETVEPITMSGDGYRHSDQWSYIDLDNLLVAELPSAMNGLTRAQRLTVADELAADAAERAEALRLLPTGYDPEPESSRVWQMCEVTRARRNGQVGDLPEGAAGWMLDGWGPEDSPACRWGLRERLVRIEQLVAACLAYGGRGGADEDPLQAHLVIPHAGFCEDDQVIYVRVHPNPSKPWSTDAFAPMTITSYRGQPSQRSDLGELDPNDDEGFARVLGEWTRLVPYRR